MLDGYEEGFTPGRYESAHWASREALQAEIAARGGLELVEARDLGPAPPRPLDAGRVPQGA